MAEHDWYSDLEVMMADPITVGILVTDSLHAAGVATILKAEPGLLVRNFSPNAWYDVIVADLAELTQENLRLLTQANTERRTTAVVLSDGHDVDADEMVAAGVVRIVHTVETTGSELLAAVRHAHAATTMTQQHRRLELDRHLERRRCIATSRHTQFFSVREIAVLRHLAEGSNTADITKKMHISERTVKYILWNIMQRVGLRNRVHAVAFAIRAGHI